MSIVSNIKNYLNDSLTFSKETHEKIQASIKKIEGFVNENKSLIFFGLTVCFSFYMAPVSALEYFSYFDISLKEMFIEGIILGAWVLILKNLFASSLTTPQDDKINYLAGIANIGETYLSPTFGLAVSVTTCGFIALKTLSRYIFPQDRDIYFMVEKNDQKV
jgi:hypothetical protein